MHVLAGEEVRKMIEKCYYCGKECDTDNHTLSDCNAHLKQRAENAEAKIDEMIASTCNHLAWMAVQGKRITDLRNAAKSAYILIAGQLDNIDDDESEEILEALETSISDSEKGSEG